MAVTPRVQTIEDLIALPDDGKHYELHNGVIIEVGTSSRDHTKVGAQIVGLLIIWRRATKISGEIASADGTFKLDERNTCVSDAAYVSAEKVKTLSQDAVYYPFAPDLAVEVQSPSQSDREMRELAELYLHTGSRLVWTVDYRKRVIIVYRPGQKPFEITGDGVLNGYDVLPGFEVHLSDVFIA